MDRIGRIKNMCTLILNIVSILLEFHGQLLKIIYGIALFQKHGRNKDTIAGNRGECRVRF